jgi:hypothetical protein
MLFQKYICMDVISNILNFNNMKTGSVLYIPLALVVLTLVYSFGGDAKWPGGSPGGYSGSPGDGKDCTQCHGGSASQVSGWIYSDIPAEGYIPGETYTISVSIPGTGDKGFEISPQDPAGGLLGTLADGPNVHLVAGNTAVTQDNASSANPAEWQFEWTAPEAGTGTIIFYGAFTVNKPVTKLCTMEVDENTSIYIPEPMIPAPELFPNPARDNVMVSYYAAEKGETAIYLISMNGRSTPVFESSMAEKGLNEVRISIPSGTPPGLYLIRIVQAGHRTHNKIMIK